MIIKKLHLENIRSYKDLTIEFPKGSVLLSGDIGSGKTSILLGLQFALFGLQPGQKGASLLRHGAEYAYACLEIDVDGKAIILERTIKKSRNGGITQESNILTTNSLREELSTSEMKDRVMSILNYPKEFVKKSNLLYKFTVYTPQEEMKSIIQEKPEVRLDTLRHIFGIDRYKRIKENSQIFLQEIKDRVKIKEVMASELNSLKEKLNLENEKKISLAREINNLNIEYQNFINKKKDSESKLNFYKKTIEEKKELESKISHLETMIIGKKDFESRMKKEIQIMQKQISEDIEFSEDRLRENITLLNKHRKILEDKNLIFLKVNSQISVLNSKKGESVALREKITSLENCPTCFRVVSLEHKNKISKRTQFDIEEIDRELGQEIIKKQSLVKEIETEKKLIWEYEKDLNDLQQNKIKFEHQNEIKTKIKSDFFVLDRTSNEIQQLKNQIDSSKSNLSDYSQYSGLFEKVKKEFEEIDKFVREKEILLATKNKELEILKVKIGEIQGEVENKKKFREQAVYLKGLQDWLEEKFLGMVLLIEKNVMVKLREEFSSIFSEWFLLLAPFSLSVRLDEEFTPVITNQDYEINYEFLSGGERTAVALAYRLALNQVLNSLLSRIKTKDLVILDEPTEGFASEQLDKMRDIFEQLNMEQIILVSHEQKIESFVDHVIKVKKEGTSRIEE
jgi:exonuclease SbcC